MILRLLAPGGQVVAITPRSFCNGPYFRTFREDFLNRLELRRIHVFDSRQAAFKKESVLQENVIFHAVKESAQPTNIVISSSGGAEGDAITELLVPFNQVVRPNDAERFIHIPSTAGGAAAKGILGNLRTTLAELGLVVSTGRVVDFRLEDAIRKVPGPGTVPLVYPCHFNGGTVHWPKLEGRKPNASSRETPQPRDVSKVCAPVPTRAKHLVKKANHNMADPSPLPHGGRYARPRAFQPTFVAHEPGNRMELAPPPHSTEPDATSEPPTPRSPR